MRIVELLRKNLKLLRNSFKIEILFIFFKLEFKNKQNDFRKQFFQGFSMFIKF